jgi:hypothetical protein
MCVLLFIAFGGDLGLLFGLFFVVFFGFGRRQFLEMPKPGILEMFLHVSRYRAS